MGVSVCARFKNEEEQDKIYQFFRKNTDIIESLSIAEGRPDVEGYTDLDFDLSYAPQVKHLLGYDCSSGRPYYVELLIAWMATKSTYRDKTGEAFIYYDREKVRINQKNSLFIQVDEKGIQSAEIFMNILKEKPVLSFNLYNVKNFEEYSKEIESLFNLLEERWQKFQLTKKKEYHVN